MGAVIKLPAARGVQLTEEQRAAHDNIIDWYKEARFNRGSWYTSLAGYAGTGKTTLMACLSKSLHELRHEPRLAFAAFTGKAASVLRKRLESSDALLLEDQVGTLHSMIYRLREVEEDVTGRVRTMHWDRRYDLQASLIVVDEASMMTDEIVRDIKGHRIPTLFVGDPGQLPPVNGTESPVLRKPHNVLNKVHRQALENPIIHIAHAIRTRSPLQLKEYGPGVSWHGNTKEATTLLNAYFASDAPLDPDSIVLCPDNYLRVTVNKRVRNDHGFPAKTPQAGERVVCLRNNHQVNMMNGQLGTILEIEDFSEDCYRMRVKMDDLDAPVTSVCLKEAFNRPKVGDLHTKAEYSPTLRLLGPPTVFGHDERHMVDITTLGAGLDQPQSIDLFDYGYAITIHKSQGSEWRQVVLLNKRMGQQSDDNYRRMVYTAVTRSSERLFVKNMEKST